MNTYILNARVIDADTMRIITTLEIPHSGLDHRTIDTAHNACQIWAENNNAKVISSGFSEYEFRAWVRK